ncbi:MAG: DUF488 family protein [Steroidobacteraceae bacterium]
MAFLLKRVYEPARPSDGVRVLVDRLWPRGLSRADARLTLWLKEVAPSTGLRTWFSHQPERFAEFSRRYRRELAADPALSDLRRLGRGRTVTLLYAAHDPEINHAVVLLQLLRAKHPGAPRKRVRAKAARA